MNRNDLRNRRDNSHAQHLKRVTLIRKLINGSFFSTKKSNILLGGKSNLFRQSISQFLEAKSAICRQSLS